MEIREAKQALRREVAAQKRAAAPELLHAWSEQAAGRLEAHPLFRAARCIALYDALPGEVETRPLLLRWAEEKQLLLPVVRGEVLQLLRFRGTHRMSQGAFGIWEPDESCEEVSLAAADLLVIPGVAFDAAGNRMGRGRGFYDRLIKDADAPKIGLCFGFQMRDAIPTEPFDRPMDLVITEGGTFQSPTTSRMI